MTKETQNTAASDKDEKRPDYIARAYRQVRMEDGFRNRKETVGAAWINPSNGSITFRPNGIQIFENDIYLFPTETKESQ